jgi:hypothetical protein
VLYLIMTGGCPQQILGILLILLTRAQSTILFPAKFANQTAICWFHELHGTLATTGKKFILLYWHPFFSFSLVHSIEGLYFDIFLIEVPSMSNNGKTDHLYIFELECCFF